MAKRLNWEGQRFRKTAGPLVSRGMERDFNRQARQLAERAKKGHRNPQAHLHGQVRSFSEEEKAAYAAKMGWKVKSPTSTPPHVHRNASVNQNEHDAPWWSEEEWGAGERGLADKTAVVVGWCKRAGKEPKKRRSK